MTKLAMSQAVKSGLGDTQNLVMTNNIIKFDGTGALANIQQVDDLNTYINDVLARYDATKGVKLNWQPFTEDAAKREAQSLTKLVSASQDARGLGKTSKEEKSKRTEEFRAVRGVFINEGLNDLIEAFFRKLGYQTRFTGIAKNGTGNVQFVPPTAAAKDAVGKAAGKLKADQGAANLAAFLQNKGITAAQLQAIKSGDRDVVDIEVTVSSVE
jgi:hypothetical protein